MRTIRLFTDQPLSSGAQLQLEEGPANHLVKVLRARLGDSVQLFNGEGIDWHCVIASIERRKVLITVGKPQKIDTESPLETHLGLCLSKGERFDWAIQKATEMGVTHITPIMSERVDVKLPADRLEKKQRHWQHIVISACEQCGRAVVPPVASPMPLSQWLTTTDADLKLVLHHHNGTVLPVVAPNSAALLIGPEGGLTNDEVSAAQTQGFSSLRLGPRVMRTETAPVAALAILASRWGDI